MNRFLEDEQATLAQGAQLAAEINKRYNNCALVFLNGQLGAGKTTMVRGLLHTLDHSGAVKSPTYTLLEPYELAQTAVFHFDLYRVNDPQELEFVGIDEIIDGPGIKLFEWAEQALSWLPQPQVIVNLDVAQQQDKAGNVLIGRTAEVIYVE